MYSFGPPVAGVVFFSLTGRVPLAIQVLNAAWLLLIVFFTPSLPELCSPPTASMWRSGERITSSRKTTSNPKCHSATRDSQEVRDARERVTESAGAKLRGDPAPEGEQARDRDAIERWAEAEGVDMEGEAQRAKQKLRNADQARE